MGVKVLTPPNIFSFAVEPGPRKNCYEHYSKDFEQK